jgi:EmrB/QacA subfamily drug resistance transporter
MSAGFKSRRPLVIAAVMASLCMVAIEATIVSTAMPQIIAQLGGLKLYSWVFSAFLLTQTVATVVFGKLSDIYGRKPIMLVGIAVFLVGSVMAGFAWSMPAMIAFRLLQGIGAGAVQPVSLTIVSDLYPGHERGKVQGYLASVWAISAVLGPIVGGLIIRDFSWAWIFWINVPIGIGAAAGFIAFLREDGTRERRSIDYLGTILFSIAIAALLVMLTEMEDADIETTLIALVALVVSLVLFVIQETRAADPIVSLKLWGLRPIVAANGAIGFGSMAVMGLTTFLPMYVQGVLHRSPIIAGLTLTMMLFGWPAGATVAARSFHRFGLRPTMVTGSILVPIGSLAFIWLGPSSSPVLAAVGSLVMGFGMGLISISSLVLISEIVLPSQRGSATASNVFARNLGSTLGATVLGAVLNYGLNHGGHTTPITSDQLRQLIDSSSLAVGENAGLGLLLEQSLHLTFWAMALISLAVFLFAILVPSIAIKPSAVADAEIEGELSV